MAYLVAETHGLKSIAKYSMRNDNSNLDLNGLLPFLHWLDEQLAQAIATVQAEEEGTSGNFYLGLVQPPLVR